MIKATKRRALRLPEWRGSQVRGVTRASKEWKTEEEGRGPRGHEERHKEDVEGGALMALKKSVSELD